MIDGEKRVVTFMGQAGRKTASIVWKEDIKMFEVDAENPYSKETKFFTLESEAQRFAELYCWEEKYGNV